MSMKFSGTSAIKAITIEDKGTKKVSTSESQTEKENILGDTSRVITRLHMPDGHASHT